MFQTFKSDQFKILQIADTQEGKNVSPDTIDLINAALDREEPDFVVFTGDQIWGKKNFNGNKDEVKRVLYALAEPVFERNIPWTICFGNHDRQVGLSNDEQFEIYKTLPLFVGENNSGADGTANQVIEIKDNDEIKFLLYFIDSHTSLKVGYDNVHENQIEWYKKTRDSYEEKYGAVIPSIVFQHIPVPEVMELLLEAKKSNPESVQGFRNHAGKWYVLNKDMVNENAFMWESPADPMENSGEFDAMCEKGDVRGIYFGHDHNNSFNGKVRGIDVGYTQGAGFHVYGPGLNRGVRMVNLNKDQTFETYDLRFKKLVGKGTKEPFRYKILQIMPTNVFDAVHNIMSFFIIFGATAIITLLLLYFFG